jgi:hypothetical protein
MGVRLVAWTVVLLQLGAACSEGGGDGKSAEAGRGGASGSGASNSGQAGMSGGTGNSGAPGDSGRGGAGGFEAGDSGETSVAGSAAGGPSSGGAAGDDSGTVSGAGGGAASEGGAGGAVATDCSPEMLLLLDRSVSMHDHLQGTNTMKWDYVVREIDVALLNTESQVSWALKLFPEGIREDCDVLAVTSLIDVPFPGPREEMSLGIHASAPLGGGTPMAAAVNAATTYLTSVPTARRRFLVLVTDGAPTCGLNGTTGEPAVAHAIEAVQAAAVAGIHTFVVGIDVTQPTVALTLDNLAIAGREPIASDNPLVARHYSAATTNQLANAMSAIVARGNECP